MKDPTLNQPPAADVQPPPPAKSEPETVDRVGLSEAVDEQTGSEDASEDTATPFGAGIA